jgi:hypothetical protein
VQLALPFGGDTPGRDFDCRASEMLHEMVAFRADVAMVEIDEHHLRLHDAVRPSIAGGGNRAGRHEQSAIPTLLAHVACNVSFAASVPSASMNGTCGGPSPAPFSASARTGTHPSQYPKTTSA